MSKRSRTGSAPTDRNLSIRAIHHDEPDLLRLSELIIRLALEESGRVRAERRAVEPPRTYQPSRVAS